ncbi:MAG: ATP synthase F1 subunit delta, partial [Candidatus Gastranaerophilales bacterium]|nr:ATP synthase F1 subunit delta [Candidatus Gastranaerophilales bacterium]
TLNFIQILIDENRIECITQIRDFFEECLNAKNNLITLEVTLAIDPKPDLAQLIQKTLEKKYNSSLRINFLKNEEILGGMLIKYGDTVIDLSVRNKIENFSKI